MSVGHHLKSKTRRYLIKYVCEYLNSYDKMTYVSGGFRFCQLTEFCCKN